MAQAPLQTSRSEPRSGVNKLRRGTTSCWECKNRKIRCCFGPESTTVCISCRRRRCDCVPQDLPNPDDDQSTVLDSRYFELSERILQVEGLVKSLVRERTEVNGNANSGVGPHRRPISKKRAREVALQKQRAQYRVQPLMNIAPANDFTLGRMISSYLPPVRVAAIILGGGVFAVRDRGLANRPEDPGPGPAASQVAPYRLPAPPPPTAPPATLAKYLLQLATRLQEMSTESITPELQLAGRMRDVAQGYFDAASRYVTSQTSLLLSIDGLETLVLEVLYLANTGNWRLSWLVCRRAMSIAQVLGLHLPRKQQHASETKAQEKPDSFPIYSLWPLLISIDLYMSLLLCCSPAVSDKSLDAPPNEDHSKELERIHAMVMRKLITRNENLRRSKDIGLGRHDQHEETKAIDDDLKRAARALSHAWWTPPCFSQPGGPGMDAISATAKLLLQLHHYNILLLLHLPYIVPAVPPQPLGTPAASEALIPDYTYCKLSALAASRELISRFIIYHNSGSYPFSSRGLGFKAFTAGTVMLLAHISGQSHNLENVLEHQRLYDMRITSELVATLEEVDARSDDPLSQSSLRIIKKLMHIQDRAEAGVPFLIWTDGQAPLEPGFDVIERENVLEFSMPYFNKTYITMQAPGYAGPLRGWHQVRPGYFSGANANRPGFEIDELPDWWPQSRQKFLQSIDDSEVEDPPQQSLPSSQTTTLMNRSLDWPIEGSNSTGLYCVMPADPEARISRI